MKFDVVRKESYTLSNDEIIDFKKAMLEYLKEEMCECGELEENQDFPYTISDIPDHIIEEVLAKEVQGIYEDSDDYYCSGIYFNNYLKSIFLDCDEEGVRDCIYEAVANWRTEMEEK